MTYVYIIIAVLVIGFIYLMKLSGQVMSKMKGYSDKAVIDAKEKHNVNLDFSIESLEEVNKIIQKLHSEENCDHQETSMLYGGYIGEVIIKLVENGFWVQDHPEMGKNLYPVKMNKEIMHFQWFGLIST